MWISSRYESKECNYNEVLKEIIDRIETEVLDSLSDGGDDWFTAGKVNEVVDIIKEYMSN